MTNPSLVRIHRATCRIVAVVALLAAILVASHVAAFRWTILVPATVFAVLQLYATTSSPSRETFFKFSDYFYYALIAGAVGVGSRYALQWEAVTEYKDKLDRQRIEQRISEIETTDLPMLRSRLESVRASLAATDPRFVEECRREELARKLGDIQKRFDKDANARAPAQFSLCQGYAAVEQDSVVLPMQITAREGELAAARQQLAGQRKPPTERGLAADSTVDLEFRTLPLLLGIGIAIKLGKTTSSLVPLPKAG